MEHVEYCQASPRQVTGAWVSGLSAGLAVYAVLGAFGVALTRAHVAMALSYRTHAHLARVVPSITLVGTVAFLADAHKERHSLVTCEPWGGVQWVTFLVHVCFVVRLIVHWCLTYRPQMLVTLVDVWLFTQACVALHRGFNLYAFTFITLIRFLHPECIMAWSRLSPLLRSGSGVVLVVLVVAGALQVAEEHGTLYGVHTTGQGTLQPIRSFWGYVYWSVVTVSTVGYGEITPSTSSGRVVAVVAAVIGVICYVAVVGKMSAVFATYFREGRYPPPESSCPRMVVVGESDPGVLARLLRLITQEDAGYTEVVVLAPREATHRYLRLASLLPVTVVSSSSLQQDLPSLLPRPQDNHYSSVRQHDAVVLFGDHETDDPEAEDIRTLQLLVQARAFVPDTRFVVQVLLNRSRRAVQQTPRWCSRDEVVCMEELTSNLLVQGAACSAAAPIMASLIKAPTTLSSVEGKGLSLLQLSEARQEIRFYAPNKSQSGAEDFVEAALKLYEEEGDLLLGWISAETHDFDLFPDQLPRGVQWVVISTDAEPRHSSTNGERSDIEQCCGGPEEVDVAVYGAEPGRGVLETALLKCSCARLIPEEDWADAATVVMLTAGQDLIHTMEAHYMRARITEKAAEASDNRFIRFLTDVHPGQGQRALDHRTTCDVVNKSIVVHAIAATLFDRHTYRIWHKLVANYDAMGVRVAKDCTYGQAFRSLLQEQRLLPVGVQLVQEQDCCLPNPPAFLRLAPKDLILCYSIPPTTTSLSPPSHNTLTLSQGAVHSHTS